MAGFVATIGCLAFCIAATVDPYDDAGRPRTHGTHRQLGLPPCTMLSLLGFPCPSCGMTTAISLVMHGDLTAAWQANWAGIFIAAAGIPTTAWLALLACGAPRRFGLSMENVVLGFTLAGATFAAIRYLGIIATWAAGGR